MTMRTSIIIGSDSSGAQRDLDQLGGAVERAGARATTAATGTDRLDQAQRRAAASAREGAAASQAVAQAHAAEQASAAAAAREELALAARRKEAAQAAVAAARGRVQAAQFGTVRLDNPGDSVSLTPGRPSAAATGGGDPAKMAAANRELAAAIAAAAVEEKDFADRTREAAAAIQAAQVASTQAAQATSAGGAAAEAAARDYGLAAQEAQELARAVGWIPAPRSGEPAGPSYRPVKAARQRDHRHGNGRCLGDRVQSGILGRDAVRGQARGVRDQQGGSAAPMGRHPGAPFHRLVGQQRADDHRDR